jgi:signal transduction histidine kinase
MHKIDRVSEIAPDLPRALIDASRMEQALQNLLHNNAVRHTSPGGIVAVAVNVEDELLSIRVSDTGEGIAPERLSRIWERFYQGEHHTQEHGAGLGLALVKEWIEGMGGSVGMESTE